MPEKGGKIASELTYHYLVVTGELALVAKSLSYPRDFWYPVLISLRKQSEMKLFPDQFPTLLIP